MLLIRITRKSLAILNLVEISYSQSKPASNNMTFKTHNSKLKTKDADSNSLKIHPDVIGTKLPANDVDSDSFKIHPDVIGTKFKINLRSLLVIVICLTGISVIYQQPLVQVVLLTITMLLLFILRPSTKSRKQLLHRISRIGRIIIVIFIFQLLFRRTGNVIFEYSILRITDTGINYALASSLRFFLIILVAGLLMDCPFQEYLIALNAWKFPYEIAFIVAATIHFLPVFKRIFQNKMETLALRNISLKKITLPQRFHIFKTLLIPILATAIQNLQNQAISLELRAFRLHPTRTYLHQNKLHPIDLIIITLALFFTIISLITLN